MVQDHLILFRVEGSRKDMRREKMKERKAERLRSWVAKMRRRDEREPMKLETGETLEGLVDGPVAAVVCD